MTALSRWPALVLAAGLATRLQPLSSVRAKAALPVGGVPLVVRILRWLQASGVTRVVVNLHHRAATITREIGDGSQLGLDVKYSWEPEVLGSAGGPARALPLLQADRFLIVNGDTLTSVDLGSLAARHIDTNALVTMAAIKADPRYNAIAATDAGIVTGFAAGGAAAAEASKRWHFLGIQAVNAAVFSGISPGRQSETVHGFYPALIASRPGSVRVFGTDAAFVDIGTPRDYLQTAIRVAAAERKPLDRGERCEVAADARVDESILWDDVTIGGGATVSRCIVTDGVRVPAGAKYHECSLVMRHNEMVATPF
jgi:NDP-sugar pyrophosphorylase family protein